MNANDIRKGIVIMFEGDLCKVQMIVTYDMAKMKGIPTPLAEEWIIENGNAWYVYR